MAKQPVHPNLSARPVDLSVAKQASAGSPFVVGLPLRADQPLFGRDAVFRDIANELAAFRSLNVVGERRMGKTSVINHLVGRQDQLLVEREDQPPLLLAHLDLQDHISDAPAFYGAAMRELLRQLKERRPRTARQFAELQTRLSGAPTATATEFKDLLRQFAESKLARPVLLVDEFEHVFKDEVKKNFSSSFFDGLRSLQGQYRLAMVAFTLRPLREHAQERGLDTDTSTFLTYFQPLTLEELTDEDANALLMQLSDHRLTNHEAKAARKWAGNHPCRLQAAGTAWYQAKSNKSDRPEQWARKRFEELASQNCYVNPAYAKPLSATRARLITKKSLFWFVALLLAGIVTLGALGKWYWLKVCFVDVPVKIGGFIAGLGNQLDDIKKALLGLAVVVILMFVLFGGVGRKHLWDYLSKKLELGKDNKDDGKGA